MLRWPRCRTRRVRGNRHVIPIQPLHRCHKPIAQTRPSFDVSRTLRKIPKDAAQLVDRGIQAVVEGHIGIRPEFLAKHLSSYHLPGALDQHLQDLEGLFF